MRESKDLSKVELHDLFADLKAYEFELNMRTEDEPSTSQPTKALTSTVIRPPVEEAPKRSAEQISNEAMTLFVKKFGRFMRKNNSKFKNYHKSDHTDDGPTCFNCGKPGHFIADCTKPKSNDQKQLFERRRGKEDKRTSREGRDQRVLVADESKSKWAESDSDNPNTGSSSDDSDDEKVECLMADIEEEAEEVFDFGSPEFTHSDLVTALHEMANEYKTLSKEFEEVKAERADLKDKSSESSCMQRKELDGLKVKLSLLATENDTLKRVFQATLTENKKLLETIKA
ncbi:uncharacterized protein [Henckelia pumila]|uniref:uncharacterized protein n=1 Tax=Henckelia pumila TaxID=405737 RepID=UPI003C6E6EFD